MENDPPVKKSNFFKTCFAAGCGSCLGCFGLIVFLGGIITLAVSLADDADLDSDLKSDVSVKTVPDFNRYSKDYIAVIPVHGVISPGRESYGTITPEQFARMMERAEKDQHVCGVIISIDSPGGEVNAADEIYNRILSFKRKTNLPVIALMRSVAASGGYYVAAACDKIVAADTTLTGSIGVIISSYNITGLLEKIGVKGEVYKSGALKDMLSSTRPRTAEEQKIVQELVQDCYLKFASIVSRSRKIPLEKITRGPIGDGRVYHGKKALSYGMVDKLGHLPEAVALCEKLANVKQNSLTVKRYKKELSFMQMLLEEKNPLLKGVDVNLNLPGNSRQIELEPGRIYLLPAWH